MELFILGYARIVLAIVSFYYMPRDYVIATWCYVISGLLDALDGHAARLLNQCKLHIIIEIINKTKHFVIFVIDS